MSYHDVIEYSNAHDVTDFFQAACDLYIFGTRCRVAAWMVVDKDDRGSRFPDHRVVNFTWVNQGCSERAFGDLYIANLFILVVQQNHVEQLAFFFFKSIAEMAEYIFGAAQ